MNENDEKTEPLRKLTPFRLMIDAKGLQKALEIVSKVSPGRHPNPTLRKTALLSVGPEGVFLAATDYNTTVRVKLRDTYGSFSETDHESVVIPIPALLAVVKGSKKIAQMIMFSFDENGTITIEEGSGGRRVLKHESPEQCHPDLFPGIPVWTADAWHAIPCEEFAQAVKRTEWTAEPSTARYTLESLEFDFHDDKVSVTGTNGRTLATVRCLAEYVADSLDSSEQTAFATEAILIHAETAKKIAAVAEKTKGSVFIAREEREKHENGICYTTVILHVNVGSADYTARADKGRYPKWHDVIPSHFDTKFSIGTTDLLEACKDAIMFTDDTNQTKVIEILVHDQNIVIEAGDGDEPPYRRMLSTKWGDGWDQYIRLNVKAVAEALRVVSDQTIRVKIGESNTAIVIETEDEMTRFLFQPIIPREDKWPKPGTLAEHGYKMLARFSGEGARL